METFKEFSKKQTLAEAVEYHLKNDLPFHQNIFRIHSEYYYDLFKEVREQYNNGTLKITNEVDLEFMKSDLGEFVEYEGELVPLDMPLMEKEENVELNKPKRGGPKKYYVYVKNENGNVVKVAWGDTTGLKVKINDPAARKSFAARHKCDQANDKTTPRYWACRLPRYAKQLGLTVDNPSTWW